MSEGRVIEIDEETGLPDAVTRRYQVPEMAGSHAIGHTRLPSCFGMNPDHLRQADTIEIVVGQGAKPGGGGMLLGQQISPRVAAMRRLPEGVDERSACRHPDWTGPDDLAIKILERRQIISWEKPIDVKIGGVLPYYDTALAVKAGADVVSIDMAALIALNCNRPLDEEDCAALGSRPGSCHHGHTESCPVGITPQAPELEARLDAEAGARQVENYIPTLTMEAQTLARANGKSHVHNLEPEDLVALTVEAAAMAGVPLAGTSWIPGR